MEILTWLTYQAAYVSVCQIINYFIEFGFTIQLEIPLSEIRKQEKITFNWNIIVMVRVFLLTHHKQNWHLIKNIDSEYFSN